MTNHKYVLWSQDRIQDFGLGGPSGVPEGTRIEAPQALRVYGGGVWVEHCPLPRKIYFYFWVSKMHILVRSPANQ